MPNPTMWLLLGEWCPVLSINVVPTKVAFLLLADGRATAGTHVAREKGPGSGPEKPWTAVICLENMSLQSDVWTA